MTNETTNPYRAVLEELAQERGLSGAEELASRAAEVDPDFTAAELLDPKHRGGFGPPLAEVLGLGDSSADKEEKRRISNAWAKTYLRSASSAPKE